MDSMDSDMHTERLTQAVEYFCSEGDKRAGLIAAMNHAFNSENIRDYDIEAKQHLLNTLSILNIK